MFDLKYFSLFSHINLPGFKEDLIYQDNKAGFKHD